MCAAMKHSIKVIGETQRQHAIQCIKLLPLDVVHVVEIKEYKKNRSLEQNSLHWDRLDVIRLHIADSTGQVYSQEELHDFFKSKFLPIKFIDVGGEIVEVRRSTKKLNTKEFSEFMDQIDRYCIERLNLFLPTPEMMGM